MEVVCTCTFTCTNFVLHSFKCKVMADSKAQQYCQWNTVYRGHCHLFTLDPVLLVLTTHIIYHRNWEAIHSHNHSVSHTVATNNLEGIPTM